MEDHVDRKAKMGTRVLINDGWYKSPFSARSLRVVANGGAVDHVLPVIGQHQLDEGLKESIPNALLSPSGVSAHRRHSTCGRAGKL